MGLCTGEKLTPEGFANFFTFGRIKMSLVVLRLFFCKKIRFADFRLSLSLTTASLNVYCVKSGLFVIYVLFKA